MDFENTKKRRKEMETKEEKKTKKEKKTKDQPTIKLTIVFSLGMSR